MIPALPYGPMYGSDIRSSHSGWNWGGHVSRKLHAVLIGLVPPQGRLRICFNGRWPSNCIDLGGYSRWEINEALVELAGNGRLGFTRQQRSFWLFRPSDTEGQHMTNRDPSPQRRRPRPSGRRTQAAGIPPKRRRMPPRKRPAHRSLH